ncbi:MAG: hypothetical protein MHM6MM_007527 [Cercozoa sp. M6MM]
MSEANSGKKKSGVKNYDLPHATVRRIVQRSTPEGTACSKEAKDALAHAAAIFIMCMTDTAREHCALEKRSIVSAQDMMRAIHDWGFEEFLEPLGDYLQEFRQTVRQKKDSQRHMKQVQAAAASLNDDEEEEEVDQNEMLDE